VQFILAFISCAGVFRGNLNRILKGCEDVLFFLSFYSNWRVVQRIMPTSYTTIAAASHRHVRNTAPKPRVPLSTEERTRKREEREERRDQQDQAVLEWVSETFAKADELATRFKRTQHYFLDVLFQGGAHMINHQDEVNPYNAWKTVKAAESREGKHVLVCIFDADLFF
jgi:hypothetical protein